MTAQPITSSPTSNIHMNDARIVVPPHLSPTVSYDGADRVTIGVPNHQGVFEVSYTRDEFADIVGQGDALNLALREFGGGR